MKQSKMVFVNSMSDLFHDDIPLYFIQEVFKVMNENPNHVFQVLTKRSERLAAIQQQLKWTHNIWMGVSVENERVTNRIDDLRKTYARVKFLSCEPLIGPLPDLNLKDIDWVIVGGESGRKPRSMDPNWVLNIQDQCEKAAGRLLNGRTHDEMPHG